VDSALHGEGSPPVSAESVEEPFGEPRAPVATKQPVRAAPAAAPAAKDEENPEALALAETADQGEAAGSGPRPSPLDLSFDARFATRAFAYNDAIGQLRGYSLGLSPNASLQLHWYPIAHFNDGALANIGFDLRGDLMMGVSSKNTSGAKFDTGSHAFGAGLRVRVPLQEFELGVAAGFGQHAFTIANNKKVDPDIPDVVYSFIRAGLEPRWMPASWFALQLRAAFLFGLSLGEIAAKAWFPHAKGNGVEADLTGAFRIAPLLWLEAGFGMQRYFMSLNPLTTDAGVRAMRVAGGALDQYFSLKLGLSLRL
jgi:hypothetical protein